MSRRNISLVLSLLFLVVFASILMGKSRTPRANTRGAVKAYVEHAAKLVKAKGPSCDAFKDKDWMSGDYYIFVIGPDDRLLCHPNPTMVGKSNTEIVDANGKKVGVDLTAAANKKGGGWIDYVWPRPGQTTPVAKSSYAVRVKAPDGKWYVVGGGGYELK